jgi:indole-3-glycerol phosphate synthase
MKGGGVLEAICDGVRADLVRRKEALPEAELRALCERAIEDEPPRASFLAAIRRPPGGPIRAIAEVKKASPSRGPIAPGADPVAIARAYHQAGAAAISVLTEPRRFGGSLEDLARVALALPLPLLRKDFILEPYQLYEARAAGASAVLLIAALHDARHLRLLRERAAALGLDALVEIHDGPELERAVESGAAAIGVNNRDLRTLTVSLETAERLAPQLPPGVVRVGESGIARPEDVARLAACGYDAILIGERLMTAVDPGAALRALFGVHGE